jgi:hypothetical protein
MIIHSFHQISSLHFTSLHFTSLPIFHLQPLLDFHHHASNPFTSLHITSLIITFLTLFSYEGKREEQNCAIFPRIVTFLWPSLLQNSIVMFRLVQKQGRYLRNKCAGTYLQPLMYCLLKLLQESRCEAEF